MLWPFHTAQAQSWTRLDSTEYSKGKLIDIRHSKFNQALFLEKRNCYMEEEHSNSLSFKFNL